MQDHIPDPLKEMERIAHDINTRMEQRTRSAFRRYPLLFSLLVALGVASTLYGFEYTINTIPLFRDRPVLALVIGIIILAATGTLYKKIDQRIN